MMDRLIRLRCDVPLGHGVIHGKSLLGDTDAWEMQNKMRTGFNNTRGANRPDIYT